MRSEIFVPINGDRDNVSNICIIITDGNSTRDVNQTIPQAEMAHAENITIFSVGITDDVDVRQNKDKQKYMTQNKCSLSKSPIDGYEKTYYNYIVF